MHPAYSVIIFTTASGAGYGLLVFLAAAAVFGGAAADARFGLVGMALALGLISVGLVSSTLHLGRPERAWRAVSQWRTSWLSREGVLALATFVPAGVLGMLWVFSGGSPGWLVAGAAVIVAALALATVWCTGMIYQSLPTIRAWSDPLVSPIYVALALASGGLLAWALGLAFQRPVSGLLVLALLTGAGLSKLEYWRRIDRAEKVWTPESATGLGRFGKVRVLEQPHTQANYINREMGFQVARKHAEKLRRLVMFAGFALPALLVVLAGLAGFALSLAFAGAAVVSMAVGLVTERWLFFAEAQHVVTVFYGADAA